MCLGLNLSISTLSGCFDLFPREDFRVLGVGPPAILLFQFKGVNQSLSSNGPIVKGEQVRIVFCWLYTFPTPIILISRSVQRECPPLWWLGCRSISVVLIPELPVPLEQPLSSHPTFCFHPTILKDCLIFDLRPLVLLVSDYQIRLPYPNFSWSVRTLKFHSYHPNPRFPNWS